MGLTPAGLVALGVSMVTIVPWGLAGGQQRSVRTEVFSGLSWHSAGIRKRVREGNSKLTK